MSFLSKLIEIFSGYGEPIAEVEMKIRPCYSIEDPQNLYKFNVIYEDKFYLYALTALYTAKISWLFLKNSNSVLYSIFLNRTLPEFINNDFEWITDKDYFRNDASMWSKYYQIVSDIYDQISKLGMSDLRYFPEWESIVRTKAMLLENLPKEIIYKIKLYKTNNGFATFNSWSPKLIMPDEILTHYFLFLKEIYNRLNDEEQKIFKKLLISLHNRLQISLDSSLLGLQKGREVANTLLFQFESLIREAGKRIKEEQNLTRNILEKDNQKLNLVKCSRCGKENQYTNNYCTNCGQKLKK
jgi:hypothetical protein